MRPDRWTAGPAVGDVVSASGLKPEWVRPASMQTAVRYPARLPAGSALVKIGAPVTAARPVSRGRGRSQTRRGLNVGIHAPPSRARSRCRLRPLLAPFAWMRRSLPAVTLLSMAFSAAMTHPWATRQPPVGPKESPARPVLQFGLLYSALETRHKAARKGLAGENLTECCPYASTATHRPVG